MRFILKAFIFLLLAFVLGLLSAVISFMIVTGQNQSGQLPSASAALIRSTLDQIRQPEVEAAKGATEKLNLLVVGTDRQRGEMNILISLDTETTQVDLIFLPRDTYYPLKGGSAVNVDKLSKVYEAGGMAATAQAVSQLLHGIELAGYIQVDYKGFEEIITAIGGVSITVKQNMYYEDSAASPPLVIDFKPGTYTMDGKNSLKYIRYINGALETHLKRGDDLGRLEATRDFLEQAMAKALSSKLPIVINTAFKYVESNLTLADVTRITTQVAGIKKEQIFFHTLPGEMTPEKYYVANSARTLELLTELGMIGAGQE